MIVFTTFIMLMFYSCATTHKAPNQNIPKTEEPNSQKAKYSYLETKVYMLEERISGLERAIIELKKNRFKQETIKNNTYQEIPKKKLKKLPSNIGEYKNAMYEYNKGHYKSSLKLFQNFLRGDSSILTDDAKYWIAKIYQKLGKTQLARQKLKELLTDYPATNKAPQVLYLLTKLEKNYKLKQHYIGLLLRNYANTPEAMRLRQERQDAENK